jgi:hypothetical protein
MAKLFYNFNTIVWEVKGYFESLQEVKPQEAFNAAFRRKIMADNLKIFNFVTKGPEAGYLDYRDKNCAAARSYLNFPQGMQRGIKPDTQDCFVGNHRVTCPCINRQLKIDWQPFISDTGSAEKYALAMVKKKLRHRLEGGCVAFWQGISGVLYQDSLAPMQREKSAIYLIPMRAMKEEFSGNGRSRGFVNLIQFNQQPFAVEPFFDRGDFFSFHTYHLRINDNTGYESSQSIYASGRKGDGS